MATDYKSLLQQLLQKRYPNSVANELLLYDTTIADLKVVRFKSTLTIATPDSEPNTFVGTGTYTSKKLAEQAIAEEAFNAFGSKISAEPQGGKIQLSIVTNNNECNNDYKSKLQQLLQKRYPNSIINELIRYHSVVSATIGKFECVVTVTLPQESELQIKSDVAYSSKKAAEQRAAELAYGYCLGLEQFQNSTESAEANINTNPLKDYKSALQQLLQKQQPNMLISDLIRYETNPIVGNTIPVFNSTVYIFTGTEYVNFNGNGSFSSKKLAEQRAAEVAYNHYINLLDITV